MIYTFISLPYSKKQVTYNFISLHSQKQRTEFALYCNVWRADWTQRKSATYHSFADILDNWNTEY